MIYLLLFNIVLFGLFPIHSYFCSCCCLLLLLLLLLLSSSFLRFLLLLLFPLLFSSSFSTGPRASEREEGLWEGLWEGGFSEVSRGFPLFAALFNRGGNRRAFRLPGEHGDHFHCTVEPSPGHIRCRKKQTKRPNTKKKKTNTKKQRKG